MAFGVDTTGFLDSFDVDQVVGDSGKARAQEFLDSYINTAKVGGFGVDTLSTMKQKELLEDAQQSAKRSEQGAQTFGNIASFAEGLGSIGASKGGFSKFFDMGGGAEATSGIGSGGGQASLTPGIDLRSSFSNKINPIGGFGGVMNT